MYNWSRKIRFVIGINKLITDLHNHGFFWWVMSTAFLEFLWLLICVLHYALSMYKRKQRLRYNLAQNEIRNKNHPSPRIKDELAARPTRHSLIIKMEGGVVLIFDFNWKSTPPPESITNWSLCKPKTRHFPIIEMGGEMIIFFIKIVQDGGSHYSRWLSSDIKPYGFSQQISKKLCEKHTQYQRSKARKETPLIRLGTI